jgi:tape measure domain-containing protein
MADQKLNVILGVDSSKFNANLGKAQGRLKAFGSNLKSVGSTLTKTLTVPLGIAGGAAIASAAKFEKLKTTLNVLTGSAEKGAKAFADLVEFSSKTPFQLDELVKANNTMMGFGIASEDALKHLQAIGDIAAVSGGDLQGITVAFSQVAAAGRMMGQDLLQLINNGVPVIDMLSKSMGVAKSEIKELVSQGAVTFPVLLKAFQDATSEGGKFNNGMAILSNTLGGLGSTLKDNLNIAMAELGKQIVEAFDLKNKTKDFTEFIRELTKQFKSLSPETKRITIIIGGIAVAIGPVLLALGAMSSAFGLIASGGVLVVTQLGLVAGAVKTLTLALTTNPIGIMATAITTLTVGFIELMHKIEPTISRFQTFVNLIRSMGDMTKFAILQGETHLKNTKRREEEQKKLNKALEEAKRKTDQLAISTQNLNKITSGPKRQQVSNVSVLGGEASVLNMTEGNGIIPKDITNDLISTFQNAQNQLQPIMLDMTETVVQGMSGIVAGLASGTMTLGDVAGGLMSILGDVAIQLGQTAIKIGVGMLAIKTAFANPLAALAAGAALVAIGALMKGLAGSFGGGGGVPTFANGGIVSGPTLGLMGEYSGAKSNPEVIAPLSKLQGMIGQKQTQNVNVGGNFRIQGQDLVLALQKADKQRNRIL